MTHDAGAGGIAQPGICTIPAEKSQVLVLTAIRCRNLALITKMGTGDIRGPPRSHTVTQLLGVSPDAPQEPDLVILRVRRIRLGGAELHSLGYRLAFFCSFSVQVQKPGDQVELGMGVPSVESE